MLRKKAKGISIALVTMMALTSVNFGSLNEFSLFTENTAMAQEETRVLTEFEDPVFREVLVYGYLGGTDRTTVPENAAQLISDAGLGEDYEYPIFSTDIEELERIVEFSYDGLFDGNEIKSVKGIERLKNLKKLNLSLNSLNKIDISKNTELTSLDLSYNNFSELDISKNTKLEKLYLIANNFSELDISKNTELMDIYLNANNFSELDISKNIKLTSLGLSYNNFSELDISKNTELTELDLSYNNLSELDIINNTLLKYLDCSGNYINYLNLNSNNRLNADLKEQYREEIVDDKKSFNLKEYISKAYKNHYGEKITEDDLKAILEREDFVTGKGVKSYDKNSGIVTLKEGDDTFTYNLDVPVGNKGHTEVMDVTVKLISKEEINILKDFEDPVFRREVVKSIGGAKRSTLPDNSEELLRKSGLKNYDNPIFSTDIEKLEKKINFSYSNPSQPIKLAKGISYMTDLNLLEINNNSIRYLDLTQNNELFIEEKNISNQYIEEIVKQMKTFNLKEYLQKAAKEYHGDDISEEDLNKILSRVESVEGEGVESYDMDTGTVILKEGFDTFTYNLEVPVGNDGDTVTMDVTVKLIKKKPSGGSSGGSSSKPVEEPEKDKEENEEKTPETEVQDKAFVEGYEDGTFKPDASITRAEAAAMFARLLEGGDDNVKAIMPAEGFSDLSGGWYKKYMDYMAEKGIMKGYGDGTIKPESPITRAEFSQMIASQLDNEGLETDLTDIENHWAKKAVEKAFEKNIVNGYPDRTFRPDNEITRAEAAKMLNRFAGRIVDAESIKSVENPEDLVKFTDVNEDHWGYYEVMEVANSHTCERDEKTGKEKWIKIIK